MASINKRPDLSAILKQKDISPTKQRLIIADILFEKHQHLTADQVLDAVKIRDASVSRATVYNTLNLFSTKNLVRELVIDKSKVVYDSNVEPHLHIYNVDTGELTDLGVQGISVSGLPEMPSGLRVEGADVVIRVRQTPDKKHVS